MRPVNLIPPEDRKRGGVGSSAQPTRTGPAVYIVVGALAFLMAGLTYSSLLGKGIDEKKDEVVALEAQEASARARADGLRAFSDFHARQVRRTISVGSLAQSRFDWDRVMREMAGTIPADIWLISMEGATVDANLASAAVTPGGPIPPPSVTVIGCGPGHTSVAAYAAAMHDIDGVSDVSIISSERLSETDTATGAADSGGGPIGDSGECRTKNFISKFDIKVLFEAEEEPIGATTAPGVPDAAAPPAAQASKSDDPTETAGAGSPIPAGAVR